MPRRGEQPSIVPEPGAEPGAELAAPPRVGLRCARGRLATGTTRQLELDPSEFRCARLVGELGDEWVEYTETIGLSAGAAGVHRRAIRRFCAFVDHACGDDAPVASLARTRPCLAAVLAEWERVLPSDFGPGSVKPAALASALRTLITRRSQHEHRHTDDRLRRLLDGNVGVDWGASREFDEFTRAEKRAMVTAAWRAVRALEQRLAHGRALAAQGRRPGEHGWTEAANLLCGLAGEHITPKDIQLALPPSRGWPPALRAHLEDLPRPGGRAVTRQMLVQWLVRQLYPTDLDLHAFRVLLVVATGGAAPEEITGLSTNDVEFAPEGVRLTLTKRRADRVRHRSFRDHGPATAAPGSAEVEEFLDRPHRQVAGLLRRLLAVTEPLRGRGDGDLGGRLFVTATVRPNFGLRVDRWDPTRPQTGFRDWLAAARVPIQGAADIRRLRKSGKVEKALAFGGRIADAADDHHEETFRGHYAHGPTLRTLSGQVITTAQQHWFGQAIDGPTVITDPDVVDEPGGLEAAGLSREQADELRQGALDMGVTQCRDPYDSPYSRTGQLCAVAPLRCLECRNAWILPSNLPQLLLFADHLDRLRHRLAPERFAALWGQSHTNLHAVLDQRTEQEIALARDQIETGAASLHLPLSAHVEFTP